MRRNLTAVLAADVAGYSRMMSEDAEGTLVNLRRLRTEILGPVIASLGGRVVKSMGDGWVVTFDAVTDAVECAVQAMVQLKNEGGMQMRVGIHIGDIVEDEGDIYGDGVNVAARLQEITDSGSVMISAAVHGLLDGTLRPSFVDAGEHVLKNIPGPVHVWSWTVSEPSTREGSSVSGPDTTRQIIRFAEADDGAKLAYAVSGDGPGLFRIGHFPSHLELDWQESTTRAMFDELGRTNTLIRFDQRGTGLSDLEIDVPDNARNAKDMLAVADAAGLDRIVVMGTSGSGSAAAVHLAARHPDRVAGLILLGGCVDGRVKRSGGNTGSRGEPIEAMLEEGWDTQDSPFLTAYVSLYFPDCGEAKAREFAKMIQQSCPKENALNSRQTMNGMSIADLLVQVQAPTLVLHARGDSVHPISEGRKLASGIAQAEMVVLDSRNHYPLPDEPCWPEFCGALRRFLDEDAAVRR